MSMMKPVKLFCLAFLLSSFLSEVIAQTTIEEVTVTARKRVESFEDVPVAVNVFTESEIESAGIETPHDFIALTPNVTIVQVQNIGNSFVTIRGITGARNSEMSVAVLLDGVLMANPAQFNQELFDIEQIEVLKGPQGALYGRNAIGGAITIRTKAPSDELEGTLKLGVDSGPGFKVQGGLSGPVPGTDTLKFRGSFSYKDTDGYIDNPFLGEEADPYKDISGRLKLLWQPNDRFTADARITVSEMDTQALYYNIRSSAQPPFPGAPEVLGLGVQNSVNDTSLPVRVNNAGINERDLLNLSLKMDYETEHGTFTSITSYDSLEEILTGDAYDFLPRNESFNETVLSPIFLGLPVGAIPDWNQSQFLDVEAVSQEFRFTSPAENRLRWIVGAYLIATDRFISTGNMVDTGNGVFPVYRTPRGNFPFDFATDPLNPQATFLSDSQDNFAWAIYGEASYDISDQLELSFSLRYDEDNRENTTRTPNAFFAGTLVGASFTGEVREKTWDELQPKVVLRYKPADNISIFGGWSRGFRSGGFNQSGVAAAGVPGVGDIFDKEVAETIEGGIKATFLDGRLRTSLTGFSTDAEGTYFFVFLVDSSTQNLGSLDEVDYAGLEFEASANIADGLNAYFGFGYTDSEIKKSGVASDIGDPAPNVSEYTLNIGGEFRQPLATFDGIEAYVRTDFQVIGDTSFFDGPDTPDTNIREPVELLDLRFGVERPDNWSLTFWAKNLLDTEYNSEYSPGGFVFKAPPRRWGVDFVKHF